MAFMPRTPDWTRRLQDDERLPARFGIVLHEQHELQALLRHAQNRPDHASLLNAASGVTEYESNLAMDHGLQAVESLAVGLAEALTAAGLLEAQCDYYNKRLRRAADGIPYPPTNRPDEEAIFLHLDVLAISASVSACTATLDRLAAAASVILGVDRPHRRADWGQLSGGQWEKQATSWARPFLKDLAALTAKAPWWGYLNDLRNALAHRPPSMTLRVMQSSPGHPLALTLPRRPRAVLGELIVHGEHEPVTSSYLSEPAHVTLYGLARETGSVSESGCAILSRAWKQRVADSTVATLTPRQLHDATLEQPFDGFEPQADFWNLATTMMVNPRDGQRLSRIRASYRGRN